MFVVTRDRLEKYVDDYSKALQDRIETFKQCKYTSGSHSTTNENIINSVLHSFDYYFLFKYFRATDYICYEIEKGNVEDDLDGFLLMDMVQDLYNLLSRASAGICDPLGESPKADDMEKYPFFIDEDVSTEVIDSYLLEVIDRKLKKAEFEYSLSDGSTEMFNEIFIDYYILKQLSSRLGLCAMAHYLLEAQDSLLTKVRRYESKKKS